MGSPVAKSRVDLDEIIFTTTVKRGLDLAQTQIVRILGRKPPFTRVRVGRTDVNLGKTSQDRQGYTVTALYTAPNEKAVAAIETALATWLQTCHGPRFEAIHAKPVVKPGKTTIYLAVAYTATGAATATATATAPKTKKAK